MDFFFFFLDLELDIPQAIAEFLASMQNKKMKIRNIKHQVYLIINSSSINMLQ